MPLFIPPYPDRFLLALAASGGLACAVASVHNGAQETTEAGAILEAPAVEPGAGAPEPALGAVPGAPEAEPAQPLAPPTLADKFVLTAGRSIPPGLTAARTSERERRRDEATAELARALSPHDPRREPWLARLREILEGAGDAELWWAAANLVGRLSIVELADALAPALEGGTGSRRARAGASLRDIYGVWFSGPQEFSAFRSQLGEGTVSSALLERQRALEDENRSQRVRLMRYEPELALESLTSRDPVLRAEAARVLGEPGGVSEQAGTVDALFERLRREPVPSVLDRTLSSLVKILKGEDSASEEKSGHKARLIEEIETAVRNGSPGNELSLATTLARLPWGPEWGGPARLELAIDLVARLVRDLNKRGSRADEDVAAGVIVALQSLVDRAVGSGVGTAEEYARARLPVLEILADPGRDESVRLAAARAAGSMALVRDVGGMVAALDQPEASSQLQFLLLSGLRTLAPALVRDSEDAQALVDSVARRASDEDVDLRRRALAFLTDPELEFLLEGRDLGQLVDQLESENVAELRSLLLAVVRRFGDAQVFERLLTSDSFDSLASKNPSILSDLVTTLEALAGGDPERTMRAAMRLAAVEAEHARVERLRGMLRLALAVPEVGAREWSPGEHWAIVSWAMQLRSGGLLVEAPGGGATSIRQRLANLHLPLSEGGGVSAMRDYYRALLLSDLRVGSTETNLDAEIARSFDAALTGAAEEGGSFEALVRRDRARFFVLRGSSQAALQEYLWLLEWDRKPENVASSVLEVSDMRSAARLAGEAPGDASSTALVAHSILSHLVHRPAWGQEPGAVRLDDLRELFAWTRATGVADLLEQLRSWMTEEGPEDALPIWSGLEGDPAWANELADLRAALDAELGFELPAGTVEPASAQRPADQG